MNTSFADFFFKTYRLQPREIVDIVRKVFEAAGLKLSGQITDGRLRIGDRTLVSPELALGSAVAIRSFSTTVVHGDMNANNVMVSDDGRVIIIDYRHTGYGPRALDFAALECSVRLLRSEQEADWQFLLEDLDGEAQVWDSVWNVDRSAWPDDRLGGMPYWSRVSNRLGVHARLNFGDLDSTEYAITCLCWALRIVRIEDLTPAQKFRLCIWISHLVQRLP